MYLQHFQLERYPYGPSPDPRLFYEGDHYTEILAELDHAIETREYPVIKLIGESGVGKTMLMRYLRRRLVRKHALLEIKNQRDMSADNLLNYILFELNLTEYPLEKEDALDKLSHWFQEPGDRSHRLVLIMDNADDLSAEAIDVLEDISNIEKAEGCSFCSLLIGIELPKGLGNIKLCRLEPMPSEHVEDYLNTRATLAGYQGQLFKDTLALDIAQKSGGVPRTINQLADELLKHAFEAGKAIIELDEPESDTPVERVAITQAEKDALFEAEILGALPVDDTSTDTTPQMDAPDPQEWIDVDMAPEINEVESPLNDDQIETASIAPIASAFESQDTPITPEPKMGTDVDEHIDFMDDQPRSRSRVMAIAAFIALCAVGMGIWFFVHTTQPSDEPPLAQNKEYANPEPSVSTVSATPASLSAAASPAPELTQETSTPTAPHAQEVTPIAQSQEHAPGTVQATGAWVVTEISETTSPTHENTSTEADVPEYVAQASSEPALSTQEAAVAPDTNEPVVASVPPSAEYAASISLEQAQEQLDFWLAGAENAAGTIQLLLVDGGDQSQIVPYLEQLANDLEAESLMVYPTMRNGQPFYGVLYEQFPSRNDAYRALASIEARVPYLGKLITRSAKGIRQEM